MARPAGSMKPFWLPVTATSTPQASNSNGIERWRTRRRRTAARVAGGVHRAAHGGDVGHDAGRGLVMGGQHGLDAVARVGAQDLLEPVGGNAPRPRGFDDLDGQAVALAHVDPAMAEHAVARRQHRVAGRQRVGDRHFPAAGAGGGEDEDLGRLGAQDLPHAVCARVQDVSRRPTTGGRAWACRRPGAGLGHIRGAGYEHRVLKAHGRLLPWLGPRYIVAHPAHNFFEKVFQKWYSSPKC
jgi:hypothetical protein